LGILGAVGKGIPEILESHGGLSIRQIRISFLKPFSGKSFLARMVRARQRRRDYKQKPKQDKA
jgi:hypothetical protein